MKKKLNILSCLIVSIFTISCSVNMDLKTDKSVKFLIPKKTNIKLTGNIDYSFSKNKSFSTKATETEIINKANVTLSYPSNYFKEEFRNELIGTTISNENGEFLMNLKDSFAPIFDQVYVLESSKRKNGQGNDNITLRTLVRWDGSKFESISGNDIVINSKTTTLSLLAGYSAVLPQDVISKLVINNNTYQLPESITNSTTTPPTNLSSITMNTALSMVENALSNNLDPVSSVILKNGNLFYSNMASSNVSLSGCINTCTDTLKIVTVTKEIPVGLETRPIDSTLCVGASAFCDNTDTITLTENKNNPSLITGLTKRLNGFVTVKLNDVLLNPYEYVYDRSSLSIKILKNLNSGDTIKITGKNDPIGYNSGFPNIIGNTVLPYGFYFDFYEQNGTLAYDKSGNNNTGDFFKLGSTYPERKSGIFGAKSLSFTSESSLKVIDSPSIKIPDSFSYLFVFTPDVVNTPQFLAVKNISDTGDISGNTIADTSYAFFINEQNQLVCWFYSGYNVLSITDPINVTLGKPVGLGVSFDKNTRTLKIVKNNEEIPYTVDTTSQPRFIDVPNFTGIHEIDTDLHIGNHIYFHNTLSVNYPFLGRMHRVANLTQALNSEQMKGIFLNMNLKN